MMFTMPQRVYNCSGSDAYEADKNVYTSNWTPSQEAEQWLREELVQAALRTGLHIEDLPWLTLVS